MRHKILIVDDEPELREVLSRTISESLGAECFCAPNGSAAKALLSSQPGINLIITDLRMPFEDGVSFLAEVKKRNSHIRCVVISGHLDKDAMAKLLKLKIDGLFEKPFDQKTFMREVRKLVANRPL